MIKSDKIIWFTWTNNPFKSDKAENLEIDFKLDECRLTTNFNDSFTGLTLSDTGVAYIDGNANVNGNGILQLVAMSIG